MSTSPPSFHAANPYSTESRAYSTPYDSNILEEKPVNSPSAADVKEGVAKTSTLEIPDWPGPVTLEPTLGERAFGLLVSIGVLIPPLFFIGKEPLQ